MPPPRLIKTTVFPTGNLRPTRLQSVFEFGAMFDKNITVAYYENTFVRVKSLQTNQTMLTLSTSNSSMKMAGRQNITFSVPIGTLLNGTFYISFDTGRLFILFTYIKNYCEK